MRSKRLLRNVKNQIIADSLGDGISMALACDLLQEEPEKFEENKVAIIDRLREDSIKSQRLNDKNGFHRPIFEKRIALINEIELSTAQEFSGFSAIFEDLRAEFRDNRSALNQDASNVDISGDTSHFTKKSDA